MALNPVISALAASTALKGVAVVLAFAVIGGGGWVAYRTWGPDNPSAVTAREQIIPVQRGDLVSSVSVNGSLTFPERETLAFSNAGTVASISARQGQRVEAGQELARLDTATVANLERAVSQAKVDAQDAENALVLARTADPVKLAQAKVALENARKALDQLVQPTALAGAQAEAAVANARLALQKAEDAKQALLDSWDLTDLESATEAAELSLTNAKDALLVGRKSWDSKLAGFRTARDEAAAAYRDAFAGYLGVELTDAMLDVSPAALLKDLRIDPASIYARPSERAIADGLIPANDPFTAWNESTVFMWAAFFPGQIVSTCGDGFLPQGNICVTRTLDATFASYEAARDSLASQENQAAIAIAALQAAVDKAQLGRDLAATNLEKARPGADPVELAVRDQEIAVAKAKLDDAKETLATLMGEPDPSQLALKQAESDAARENLQELEAGDPLVIGLRQSALAAAKAALETAQARLEGAVLKAPWKGEINTVNISAGQAVTQATAAIEIVDPSTVQLEGSLDEIDVLFVQEGAPAQVTLDALAGAVVQGTVAEIASQGVSQQGVVTFPITIDVTAPHGVSLREGLSATATIVLNQESNVLLIPVQSVAGTFDEPVVRVATGKTVRHQTVKLGGSDGYWIVVVDGLVEGDRVVMAAPQTATTQGGGALLRGLGGAGIGIPIGVGGGPTFRVEGQGFQQRPGQGQNTGGQGTGTRGQGTQGNQRTGGTR